MSYGLVSFILKMTKDVLFFSRFSSAIKFLVSNRIHEERLKLRIQTFCSADVK